MIDNKLINKFKFNLSLLISNSEQAYLVKFYFRYSQ